MTLAARRPDRAGAPVRPTRGHRLPAARRRWWLALFLGGCIVALCVLAAVQISRARTHLERGAADLRPAVESVRSAGLETASGRAALRVALTQANGEFAAARSDLWLWSPLLVHLGWIPRYGREAETAPPLAAAAAHTTGALIDLLDGLAPLWPHAAHGHGRLGLPALAAALNRQGSTFVAVRRESALALADLQLVPFPTGIASVDRESTRLRSGLQYLHTAALWLQVMPAMLGERGPVLVLLAWQDPREIRATGGFIGAANAIRIVHGRPSVLSGSAVTFAHEPVVPLPLPEAAYTYEGSFLFRDSNISPDFPLTARMERALYAQDTGRLASLVVDVDPAAAVALLRAVGPVYVPAYRETVTASSAERVANLAINGLAGQTGITDERRKHFFGAFMRALLTRMSSVPLSQWPSLARAVARVVDTGDLMLYDRHPAVQAAIRASGADGAIVHASGDQLFVVDDNRSYNKLGPYIQEAARYDARVQPDLSVQSTLTLRYHVSPSPAGLEGAGPFFGQAGTKHDFQDFIRVYVPRGARLQRMSGVQMWAPQQAYGLTQFAGRLLVREGRTATVTIRYSLPANVLAWSGFRRYSLTIQRQTGTRVGVVDVRVSGAIAGRPGHVYHARVAVHDRITRVSVPVGAHGKPHTVRLPSYREDDPYLPYGALRGLAPGF